MSGNYSSAAAASTGNRIVAYLIDGVIVGILAGAIGAITGNIGDSWIGQIIGGVYMLVRDALPFLDGQSVGKKVMKIRVVTQDGDSISNNWAASAIRMIPLYIPLLNLYELYKFFTGQRLGDDWAKTRVVAAE